jgi:hypothetical protein
MPRSQVANVAQYDVGAPSVEDTVLKWKLRHFSGGKVTFRFEHAEVEDDANDITVSVQVSDDDASYVDTTAADNGEAVVDEVIGVGTYREFEVNLRPGQDNFVAVLASGGGRLHVQTREGGILDVLQEGQDLSGVGPVSP